MSRSRSPRCSDAKVVTKRYKKVRIKISFNPTTEEFATQTPILLKDPAWIADVADVVITLADELAYYWSL